MEIELPKDFLKRMEVMLGKEYEDFLKVYKKPYHRHGRFNSLKRRIFLWRFKIGF